MEPFLLILSSQAGNNSGMFTIVYILIFLAIILSILAIPLLIIIFHKQIGDFILKCIRTAKGIDNEKR